MKAMHSLTKPIYVFPTILEDVIFDYHDEYHKDCNNIIMCLSLPNELKITNNILNIYWNKDKSSFYFKMDNKKQFTFTLTGKNTSFDLISFILNTLSEYVGFSMTFDLILTTFSSVDTMKQYLKLPLNEIYYSKGNIIII